jgi:hypothetical protein
MGAALALGVFITASDAAAGDRWDYWDPRASIPARVIDTQLGVIALAATVAGDYRTAAVFDHISGRFPAAAPVPVVQYVHYPPPVVEHVYYPPPPVVVHHVHNAGCGHRGYDRGHYDRGHGNGHGHGRGHWKRGGYERYERYERYDRSGRGGHSDRYDRYDDRRGGYGRRGDHWDD